MSNVPKEVADWLKYVEGVRSEARDQGFNAGFEQGYQKGLDDASASVAEAIALKRAGGIGHQEPAPQNETNTKPTQHTSRDYIVIALTARPGLKPMEVASWIIANHPKMNRMTILTQIKRMRKQDAFVKRDDSRLYLTEAAQEEAA